MERFLLILAAVLWAGIPRAARAQSPDPADYIYPVCDVAGLYAASFGEMRPDHFHSGVDIKTDGVEGKPLVAVSDGYVTRIAVSPSGYGRALYLALDNGTTAVYGHISRFRDDIERSVRCERERLRRNRIDLWYDADRFPVRQGDTIAYSGNSGSSFGPHLHYEIRETATQRTLNTVRLGIIRPEDRIAPRILRLRYFETDTVRGVPIHAERWARDAVQRPQGDYRLADEGPMPVGPDGFLVLEATDRRNGVGNRFGLYRVTMYADGVPLFEYRMDGFAFDRTRYCNAVAHYPLQNGARCEVLRLAAVEGSCPDFYTLLRDRGAIGADEGRTRRIRIEVEDDCGNCSILECDIRGRKARRIDTESDAAICDRQRTCTLHAGEASLTLPAGTLYESLFVRPRRIDDPVPAADGVVPLTPRYRFLSPDIPLHRAATLRIRAYIPEELQPHATLAVVDRRGRLIAAGGDYEEGCLTARTTRTGDVLIVADTAAPAIRPLFADGARIAPAGTLRFRVRDNFSGIVSCDLHIDGRWVACDRYPMQGTARHELDSALAPGTHVARLEVRDACGNRNVWKGTFELLEP